MKRLNHQKSFLTQLNIPSPTPKTETLSDMCCQLTLNVTTWTVSFFEIFNWLVQLARRHLVLHSALTSKSRFTLHLQWASNLLTLAFSLLSHSIREHIQFLIRIFYLAASNINPNFQTAFLFHFSLNFIWLFNDH